MLLKNPYKGLFQYHSSDEHFFFGREQEAEELLDMIKNNHLVVIYGESGTGKTSLINAKLFPELRRQFYFPIYIRINYTSDSTPIEQIQERIVNQLRIWDENVPDFAEGQTLIDYTSSVSIYSGLVKPILFFDQFEELFTLGPKNQKAHILEDFINQLSDLIELRIRHSKRKMLAEQMAGAGNGIDTNYEENILRFRIVFSMRQEYVAHIDDLKFKMPSILYSKYWLKKFTSRNALEAILGPAEIMEGEYGESNQAVSYLTQDTANRIVDKLLGVTSPVNVLAESDSLPDISTLDYPSVLNADIIDPTILSLYCYQLVEVGKENDSSGQIITEELISKYDPVRIIRDYYESSLKHITDVRKAVEKLLITNEGLRLTRPLNEFVKLSGVKESTVVSLADDSALLRIYGTGSGREVEIAHDQIAAHALKSRKRREANRIKVRASIAGLVAIVVIAVIGSAIVQNIVNEKGNKALVKKVAELQNKNSNLQMLKTNTEQSLAKVSEDKMQLITEKTNMMKLDTLAHSSLRGQDRVIHLLNDSARTLNEKVRTLATENTQLRTQLSSSDLQTQINNLQSENSKLNRQNQLKEKRIGELNSGKDFGPLQNTIKVLTESIRATLPPKTADSIISRASPRQ